MRILIGADFVPSASNEKLFAEGAVNELLGEELVKVMREADYRIVNLEMPVCEKETPILKTGPNLRAKPETLRGYQALGIDLVTVANNHTLDQGKQGFCETLRNLKEAKIAYVGGGKNEKEARKPHIFELEGKKIGVYACCEHEFSWVEDFGVGTNGFRPLESLDEISELKSQVDYCIVLYHGGKEHYRYPSPYLRKVCRRMADKGADLVLCQHTHCVGARERYKGAELVYGQGNFLFDFLGVECWNTCLLCAVDLDESGAKISYIPLEKAGAGVRLSKDSTILEGFYARSAEIQEEGFVEKNFEKLALSEYKTYIGYFDGLIDEKVTESVYLPLLRNIIRCEVHSETVLTALRALQKEENLP